jgi:bacillithiol biosynthesis cysteine-adding enzyme BshC
MFEQTIKPDSGFHLSNLYLDFLSGSSRIKNYFFSDTPADAALNIGEPGISREIVCQILEKQNTRFNAKARTFQAIEKLRKMGSLCIFSGQQPGLLGGPLLTIYKAVDTVKRAALLEKEIGRRVVPVFWIACDDHDFDEINHTYGVSREGELEKISYDARNEHAVPVGEICLSDKSAYNSLKKGAQKLFGGTDFTEEHFLRLFDAFSPDKCFVEAFAQHLADILPDVGLVFFCPHDKEAKAFSKNFFKQIIERFFKIKGLLDESAASLKKNGYHVQAEKKESAAHLFYHDPDRLPIHFRDDAYAVGDKKLGLPAMLELIDKYPEKFSPDVLTRPVWQSYIFPVVAQTGGPSEIAYFCQIGKLFELFDLVQPYYYPRISATIIEKRYEESIRKYGIGLADLTGDVEQLINRVAEGSFPEDIKKQVSDFRDNLEASYKRFAQSIIEEYDHSLEGMAEQTYGKIDFALKNFEKKIFSSHKKKMQAARGQIYRLAATLYPNRGFQERSLNINYFIAKYGFDVVGHIVDGLSVDTVDHQLIYLSTYLNRE